MSKIVLFVFVIFFVFISVIMVVVTERGVGVIEVNFSE